MICDKIGRIEFIKIDLYSQMPYGDGILNSGRRKHGR